MSSVAAMIFSVLGEPSFFFLFLQHGLSFHNFMCQYSVRVSYASIEKITKRPKTFFIYLCALGMLIWIFFISEIIKIAPIGLNQRPEQAVKAEITEKRIERIYISGRRNVQSRTSYRYLIFFKFSDGSVKEFEVDTYWVYGSSKTAPYSPVYDELKEGDTGVLTYKELENIEQKYIEDQYRGRKFISFEKDAKHGGTKVVWRDRTIKKDIIFICITFGPYLIVIVILLVWHHKDKQLSNRQKKRKNKEKIRKQVLKRKKKQKAKELRKKAEEQAKSERTSKK